jgi:hypothetical protein
VRDTGLGAGAGTVAEPLAVPAEEPGLAGVVRETELEPPAAPDEVVLLDAFPQPAPPRSASTASGSHGRVSREQCLGLGPGTPPSCTAGGREHECIREVSRNVHGPQGQPARAEAGGVTQRGVSRGLTVT